MSVALLIEMSESQVQIGVAEPSNPSAQYNCTVSLNRTDCTTSAGNVNPKTKSAILEGEVRCKTVFEVNSITGGKFNLKKSRGFAP